MGACRAGGNEMISRYCPTSTRWGHLQDRRAIACLAGSRELLIRQLQPHGKTKQTLEWGFVQST